jgi:hypothetical protein
MENGVLRGSFKPYPQFCLKNGMFVDFKKSKKEFICDAISK